MLGRNFQPSVTDSLNLPFEPMMGLLNPRRPRRTVQQALGYSGKCRLTGRNDAKADGRSVDSRRLIRKVELWARKCGTGSDISILGRH